MSDQFKTGDKVVYTRAKYSSRPVPHAKNVIPSERGEDYQYLVDKYWIVAECRTDGKLILRTRRGNLHTVTPEDPCLRKASFWEKLFKGHIFPNVQTASHSASNSLAHK